MLINDPCVMSLKVRLPQDVSDEVDEDPTGNKALWDRGLLNGASQKVHHTLTLYINLPTVPI